MRVQEANKIYDAVWLHFHSKSYDYFKYDGKKRGKKGESAMDSSTNWSLVKMGRTFSEAEFPFFLAWTFYKKPKIYIKNMMDPERVASFRNWQERQKNRVENLKNELKGKDLQKLIEKPKNQYPPLFNLVGKEIGTDTFVIIDSILQVTKKWDEEMKEDFAYLNWVGLYRKFRPFVYAYMPYDRVTYQQTIDTLLKKE